MKKIAFLAIGMVMALLMVMVGCAPVGPAHPAVSTPITVYVGNTGIEIPIEEAGEPGICTTISFRATQLAIAEVWGEIVQRKDIRITTACPTPECEECLDYITKAKTGEGREGDFKVILPEGTSIENLSRENYTFTFIEKSTGNQITIWVKEGVFPEGTPRVLIAGCPMAVPNWKLPSIIETSGAVIIGEESCVGERGTQNLVDDSGTTVDSLMDAIVDRYFKVDCAIFTPNENRLEHIKTLAQKYKADGVIHYALQFCSPYVIESYPVEQALIAEGIPTIRIETDYSQEDMGQLKTRVEAFIETIEK